MHDELRFALQNLLGYITDPGFAEEMDGRAAEATGGNISAIEALVRDVNRALAPYQTQATAA